ncbi:MAG: hypothetical protein ABTD50_20900 [Polyangiaceae bacterium]|jgi:hypothetical protein
MRSGISYLIGATTVATLAVTTPGCVSKPTFHCTTDSMCVASDGTTGICDSTGSCDFSIDSGLGNADSGADANWNSDGSVVINSEPAEASCGSDAGTGCYACPPTTPNQIINACTSSTCVPFDDTNRLTNMPANGTLPPLPSGQ